MRNSTVEISPSSRHDRAVRLTIVAGPHQGLAWQFDHAARFVVGRERPSHISLPMEKAFSREHLKVEIHESETLITDLSSRNGTFLNGIRVSTATLTSGDRFGIGDTEILYEVFERTSENISSHEGKGEETLTETCVLEVVDADCIATTVPSNVPERVGDYVVRDLVGQGGMASVYRGEHEASGAPVAIKFIRPDVLTEKLKRVFKREAQVLTELDHPRIVKALDCGICDQHPYLVMEFIDSVNLLQLIDSQESEERYRTSLWIVRRLLQAVHYLHTKGIVHRDIKPGNILAYKDMHRLRVKLADFGLAKVFDNSDLTVLTNDRSIRGTVAYMSPQQFQNARDSRPSDDVFSCGAVLFRFLTGAAPHLATGCTRSLPVIEKTGASAELCQLIRTAIDPDPDKRFRNCEAFASAIDRLG